MRVEPGGMIKGRLPGVERVERNRDVDGALRNPGLRPRVGACCNKLESFIIPWGSYNGEK